VLLGLGPLAPISTECLLSHCCPVAAVFL
jgi:hypothetical protein